MKIWAHRGCSYRYPENTLSSFREACRYEITGIELDIQLSRDGEIVVIHDERVDRTTDGSGRVEAMTLRELKQLKILSVKVGILSGSVSNCLEFAQQVQVRAWNIRTYEPFSQKTGRLPERGNYVNNTWGNFLLSRSA